MARIRTDRTDRCAECGKPVTPGEPQHRWSAPGGPGMNDSRRTYTYVRHSACQQQVERMVADARADAEQQRLADIRQMAEALRIPAEQVSQMAAEVGAPDPYATRSVPA